jgi:hypothetical protein
VITFPMLTPLGGCVLCGAPSDQNGRWLVALVPQGEGRARSRVEVNFCPQCTRDFPDPVAEFGKRRAEIAR